MVVAVTAFTVQFKISNYHLLYHEGANHKIQGAIVILVFIDVLWRLRIEGESRLAERMQGYNKRAL